MARYVNVFEKKNIVISKSSDGDFSKWICEHTHMVSIETDDGRLLLFPVMNEEYLRDFTADEFLRDCEDSDVEILLPLDWKIKDNITEWICNDLADSAIEAICSVVSLLTRYGMWKPEFSKSIDYKKVNEYWND